jgi:hypothetical protein
VCHELEQEPSNVVYLSSFSSLSNRSARSATGTVAALKARLHYCDGSEDYVFVILTLVATRHPDAIGILALLLDSTGPIAEESIAGLITFGEAAIPAMRECLDSLDGDIVRHGRRVLAALGY